jgi:hypothetical protein
MAVFSMIAAFVAGCDGGTTSSPGESSTTELVRAWQTDRLRLEHETDALRSVLNNQEDDFLALTLIWAATSGALLLVILLLARQRRSQQILGRLFRLAAGPRDHSGASNDPLQQPRREGS